MSLPPVAWSWSAWEQWQKCPAQYNYQRVEKRPTEDKPFFAKGRKVHKNLEDVVKSRNFALIDKSLITAEHAFIEELTKTEAELHAEEKVALTASWGRTSYYGSLTWFRGVFDVRAAYDQTEMEFIDWKSGKKREVSSDQVELFGLTALWFYPAVERVTTRLVYVESGGQEINDIFANKRPELTEKWNARAAEMLADRTFAPRPNSDCKWCDFSRSKGGPCRYG